MGNLKKPRRIATKDKQTQKKREYDRAAQQHSREKKARSISFLQERVKVLEALKKPEAGVRDDQIFQLMDKNRRLEQENAEYKKQLIRIGFMATNLITGKSQPKRDGSQSTSSPQDQDSETQACEVTLQEQDISQCTSPQDQRLRKIDSYSIDDTSMEIDEDSQILKETSHGTPPQDRDPATFKNHRPREIPEAWNLTSTSESQGLGTALIRASGGALNPEPEANPELFQCDHCDEKPQGFPTQHELSGHLERHITFHEHRVVYKHWICKYSTDSSNSLDRCAACSRHRRYSSRSNAAGHLLYDHYKEKAKNVKSKHQLTIQLEPLFSQVDEISTDSIFRPGSTQQYDDREFSRGSSSAPIYSTEDRVELPPAVSSLSVPSSIHPAGNSAISLQPAVEQQRGRATNLAPEDYRELESPQPFSSRADQSYPAAGQTHKGVERIQINGNAFRIDAAYQNEPDSKGLYHCPLQDCHHKPDKRKWIYHTYLDSHLKPYKCTSCPLLSFSSQAILNRHKLSAHKLEGYQEYYCPEPRCERASRGFTRKETRDHHVQQKTCRKYLHGDSR